MEFQFEVEPGSQLMESLAHCKGIHASQRIGEAEAMRSRLCGSFQRREKKARIRAA
jgi:hypothetical protein